MDKRTRLLLREFVQSAVARSWAGDADPEDREEVLEEYRLRRRALAAELSMPMWAVVWKHDGAIDSLIVRAPTADCAKSMACPDPEWCHAIRMEWRDGRLEVS